MIPHETIKKAWYSFTDQKDKEPKSDNVKIANIVMSVSWLIVFFSLIIILFINVLTMTQEYEFEAELNGNITIPYIDALENTTFDKVIIKGKAKMPVYYLKGLT